MKAAYKDPEKACVGITNERALEPLKRGTNYKIVLSSTDTPIAV